MFKKGDKVILTSLEFGDTERNPFYGGKRGKISGIVEKVNNEDIYVDWQFDGFTSRNSYLQEHLSYDDEYLNKLTVDEYNAHELSKV